MAGEIDSDSKKAWFSSLKLDHQYLLHKIYKIKNNKLIYYLMRCQIIKESNPLDIKILEENELVNGWFGGEGTMKIREEKRERSKNGKRKENFIHIQKNNGKCLGASVSVEMKWMLNFITMERRKMEKYIFGFFF